MILLLVACQPGSVTGPGPPGPVASIVISPGQRTLAVSGTAQLVATAKDSTGTTVSATISWGTSLSSVATVNTTGLVVGLAPGAAGITASAAGHSATSVVTVLASDLPPVLVGAGDVANCALATQEATALLLDGIPGTVMAIGDNAYEDGTYAEYMNCYNPSWGRHKARTRPALGNHEYFHHNGLPAQADGYFQYFGAAAGPAPQGYYSYNLGAWHIIVVNSNIDTSAGTPQEQWLRADLAAHPNTCTLAYWHYPRFSSGPNASKVFMQTIWQALYDYHADVVVNGHDHDYERFAPQTPSGVRDDARGIREFVVGTGGNSLYNFTTVVANSEVRSNVTHGVMKMTLWPTSYDWEFIPIAGGKFTDKGSALCHSSGAHANQVPLANPGGPYATEGAVTLDGTGSRDPDNNTPLTYAWDLGDGTQATGATVSHTYATRGNYVVKLVVTDSKGAKSASAATSVSVGNLPPTVTAGSDQVILGGSALNLRATFADPGSGDAPWSYVIDWGDGAHQNGSTTSFASPITASHTYATAGVAAHYNVHVTVTDLPGAAGTDQFAVTVLDPNAVQVFAGAGNIASCGVPTAEATAQILGGLPGHMFMLGNGAMPSGTAANYANCYDPTWGRYKPRTYPIPGNHDYDVAGASGYFGYFGAAAGDPSKGYYSVNVGDWHVIALNNADTAIVSDTAGSAQEQWLRADLAANTKLCTLAMVHYAAYFSSNDPTWYSAAGPMTFWKDLTAGGADIVVHGQSFFYERFPPRSASGVPDPAHGTREFIVGTGGQPVQAPTAIAPNSGVVSATNGVLKLTLGHGAYIWQFIPVPGQTFTDAGSGTCHKQ